MLNTEITWCFLNIFYLHETLLSKSHIHVHEATTLIMISKNFFFQENEYLRKIKDAILTYW